MTENYDFRKKNLKLPSARLFLTPDVKLTALTLSAQYIEYKLKLQITDFFSSQVHVHQGHDY